MSVPVVAEASVAEIRMLVSICGWAAANNAADSGEARCSRTASYYHPKLIDGASVDQVLVEGIRQE